MSFCPSKDIHSIYLDNEMPAAYKAEYESHLKTCEACQKELAKLKALHSIFDEDSKAISGMMDEKALDQSFEKLMVKMNYSKNTAPTRKSFSSNFKYYACSAAAAAVVALIVPLRLHSNKIEIPSQATLSSVVPQVPASNVSFGGGNDLMFSGNIHGSVLPSTASINNGFVQNVNSNFNDRNLIQDIDVFRPAFADDKTISIKITVPGMNKLPVTAEIALPMAVLPGHF